MCRKRRFVSGLERLGSLEIDEDLVFERRQWAVQRVGWVVMLLILVAGLIGLLGPGPISHAQVSSGALAAEYERVVRKQAPSELHVRLEPGAAPEGEVALLIAQDYLDKVEIRHVLPEPSEMATAPDGTIFRFTVDAPDQPSEITFDIEPSEPGVARGQIGLLEGDGVTIEQVIFP